MSAEGAIVVHGMNAMGVGEQRKMPESADDVAAGSTVGLPALLPGVTGVILAGGTSSRMGSDKALLPCRTGRFIETIYRLLLGLCEEVLVVTNTPEQYRFLPCRKVPDLYPGMGALAGLHAGLAGSATPWIFAVACDMPCLDEQLIRRIHALGGGCDVLIPEWAQGVEPLHAFYGKGALAAMEDALQSGSRRLVSFHSRVRVRTIPAAEVALIDPGFQSFRNVNTPAEYFGLRGLERDFVLAPADRSMVKIEETAYAVKA